MHNQVKHTFGATVGEDVISNRGLCSRPSVRNPINEVLHILGEISQSVALLPPSK